MHYTYDLLILSASPVQESHLTCFILAHLDLCIYPRLHVPNTVIVFSYITMPLATET